MNPHHQELAEAARRATASGLIKVNPQPRTTEPPKGKRSPRNGAPLSPERVRELTPEVLRMVRQGYDYLSIIAKLGITAKTITFIKRQAGLPVKGDVRADGKVFRGITKNYKEIWK